MSAPRHHKPPRSTPDEVDARPQAATQWRRRLAVLIAAAALGVPLLTGALLLVAPAAGLGTEAGTVALAPMAPMPTTRYELPIADSPVVHPFDGPAKPWLPGHRGVDLAADMGTDVLAPADGVIVFAGWVVDRPTVTILHPDGLKSSLEPVVADVAVGASVRRGSIMGHLADGANHCAPASCAHWGVRRGEDYLDPMSLLGPREPDAVILLPW